MKKLVYILGIALILSYLPAYADDFAPAVQDTVNIAGNTSNTLTLDSDNTGGDVILQFGATLGKILKWDSANTRFDFNDISAFTDILTKAQGDLRLGDADTSNYVAFQAPATVISNVTWTLPAADGTNGQVLSTNGTGTLSWSSAGASPTLQTAYTGGATITTASSTPITFTLTSGGFNVTGAGAIALGNNNGTVAINSSDWDIDATGAITGASFDANGTGNSITNIESADVLDNTLTASDLAATLTFADGDLVDLSAINESATTEGLRLPQATDVSAGTAEGQIGWDTDGNLLQIGTSGGIKTIGAYNNIQSFTSSGTWTKPTGVSTVYVQVWGGGGGGGNGAGNQGGGGGGGGGYSAGLVSVSGNVTVTVGSGGGAGAAGGNSSFAGSSTLTGNGGGGGSSIGTAGTGGTGTGGTVNLSGATGGVGEGSDGGGGGSGGGSPFGGAGGGGGPGANASNPSTNGGPGGAPGGGGGGASENGGTGGSGGAGLVIVYY